MKQHRRAFIRQSLAGAAGLALAGCGQAPHRTAGAAQLRVRGANEDIRVAVIGVGSKGAGHVRHFHGLPGVRIVALCDADTAQLASSLQWLSERNQSPRICQDMREILDAPDVDAVVIATPNHWHALATVWACQAGKDVYVEKPVAHCPWEGRKMIEAAEKYGRIVQAGTQLRSDPGTAAAFEYIRQGNLGKVLLARAVSYRLRRGIGKVSGPQPIPDSVNYDLFCGPAPKGPLLRKNLHYDWHWFWNFGNGDLGNLGVHRLDLIRSLLRYPHPPPRVLSVGGRFGFDDDGETANTQLVYHDYPVPIITEIRNLPARAGATAAPHYRNLREAVVVVCEGGWFGGYAGGWIYDNDNKRVKQFEGDGGAAHAQNFISAVRSRRREELVCDVAEGHASVMLCHLGNISHRLGHEASPQEVHAALAGDADMLEAWERMKEHLAANGIDLAKTRATLGALPEMDPETETFVGNASPAAPTSWPATPIAGPMSCPSACEEEASGESFRRAFVTASALALTGCGRSLLRCSASSRPMRVGLVTYQWGKDWDLPTLLANCKAAGMEGVELRTTHRHGVEPSLSAARRREVRARFADSPVALVGLGSVVALDSPDPAQLQHQIEDGRAFVLLSRDVGSSGVKIRPNSSHEREGVPRENPRTDRPRLRSTGPLRRRLRPGNPHGDARRLHLGRGHPPHLSDRRPSQRAGMLELQSRRHAPTRPRGELPTGPTLLRRHPAHPRPGQSQLSMPPVGTALGSERLSRLDSL
ncbi:Gfo/Idh/MocA family oxidoreductase [bacterium]|nr:Gfo/Idh/MocA family oxidoreductase [bacterium]